MTLQLKTENRIREINFKDIKLNPEYQKLVPIMNKEDDQTFDESVKLNGIREPITLNESCILLDGHGRYGKAEKYQISKLRYVVKTFENKLLEKKYVLETNLQRRHLTTIQKVKLAIPLLEVEQELGKIRQKELGSKYGRGKKKTLASKDAEDKKGKSAKIISKKSGLSTTTLERGKTVLEKATPEELTALEENKDGYSISKVYRNIRKREKKKRLEESLKKQQVKLPKTIQLHNKPFQELKIKPNSISLIFTDPPYEEKSLHLYKDLAKQAFKVLREGGSLMCFSGHYCIDRVIEYMKAEGLKFHWPMVVLHSGPSASVFGRKILVAYKPILWFTKGKYEGNFVKDVIKSEFQGKELHEWAQSTVESDYYIKYLTLENDIVYDPFMGQGTFGISANKLNRQFIGAEINKEHFENAKKLISIIPGTTKKEKPCSCTCHNSKTDSICCSCTCDYEKLPSKEFPI